MEPSETTQTPAPDASGFAALGLRAELLERLDALGYEEPTPIQREAIPVLRTGRDLLGQAATGTGKTAAFALPILEAIGPGAARTVRALVLVPTRELAMQVAEALHQYGRTLGVEVVAVYGGQPITRQFPVLNRGVHVVVATPGRALDHIGRGSLELDALTTVVLDEADEMLDMGFAEDIEAILEATPSERQTVLFSATLPPRIDGLARRYQRDPVRVQIRSTAGSTAGLPLVRETVYVVPRDHKAAALARILDLERPAAALVFCRTRVEVDELTETMNGRGHRAEALHGGMDQSQRDRVMGRLRDGTAQLLVATDVAARGLDVDTLTHVVNFDVPGSPESYVHRIGRVGRAGREGVAITIAEPRHRRLIGSIEQLTGRTIEIGRVPSVGDVRLRQAERLADAVREMMPAHANDHDSAPPPGRGDDADRADRAELVFHRLVDAGASPSDVALAALRLVDAHATPAGDEADIPDASDSFRRNASTGRPARGRPGERTSNERRPVGSRPRPAEAGPRGDVYVGLGRKAGVRPADLVGAIANETKLTGAQIGPIRIADAYSVVGVPEAAVDAVVRAMRNATIRGKKVRSRRFV